MKSKYVVLIAVGGVLSLILYLVVFFHYCDLSGITSKGDAVYSCHR